MEVQYAGFWRRLGATLVDSLVVATLGCIAYVCALLVTIVLVCVVGALCHNAHAWNTTLKSFASSATPALLMPILAFYFFDSLLLMGNLLILLIVFEFSGKGIITTTLPSLILSLLSTGLLTVVWLAAFFGPNWLYRALMESSSKQATLGKMLFKIRVTDLSGQRISFWKATARHFSKIISTLLLLIGYLMASWTKEKQALHDKIAGTLVVRRQVL